MTTENNTPAVTTTATPALPVKKTDTVYSIAHSDGFAGAVSRALPKYMDKDRFLQIVYTEISRNKTLQQCDVASFTNCVLEIAQMGLDCGKQEAHLIPRKGKDGTYSCTKIIDYKGKVKLAFGSGLVEFIVADVIRSGDLFTYDMGSIASHTPHFLRTDAAKPKDAGDIIAAFATIRLKNGGNSGAVVPRAELDQIRASSKAANDGPWVTWPAEMMKKSALHRAFKLIPLSPEVKDMLAKDDDYIDADTVDITPHPEARKVLEAHHDAVVLTATDGDFNPEA